MTRPRSRFGNQRWPASRRPGIIPGRRFALALAVVVSGGSGHVADAAGNANQLVSATVYQQGKPVTSDSVSIGALEADPQQCPTYSGPTNDFLGSTGGTALPASTWALSSVLGCLTTPVPVTAVTQVSVQRLDGSFESLPGSQLSRGDLTPPGDFPTSGQLPVISSDGSTIIYNRPKRGSSDNNSGDYVLASDPSPFVIDVFEGPLLNVTVNASPTTVAVAGSVSFSATTAPQAAGLTYNWNFGGGGALNSTSPAPTETFNTQGTYSVTLLVGDAAGGGGLARVSITVGSQPASGTGNPKPGTGQSQKSPSATGPGKSQGNTAGGPARKSNGNPTGTTKRSHRQTPGSTGGSGTSSSPSTHAAATPTQPATTPAKRATGSRTTAPTKPSTPRPAFDPAHAPLITGRLVSDVTLLPASASPLVHAVPASIATAPPARRAIRASLLPAAGGSLAIFLLFALGARRELGGRRERPGWRGWRVLRAGG